MQAIRTAAEKDEVLRKLRRELAAEQCDMAAEYQLYRARNINFPPHLRASLFAPQDKYWGTVIWQEQALGQQIESTVRMIAALKGQQGHHLPQTRRGTEKGSTKNQRRGK